MCSKWVYQWYPHVELILWLCKVIYSHNWFHHSEANKIYCFSFTAIQSFIPINKFDYLDDGGACFIFFFCHFIHWIWRNTMKWHRRDLFPNWVDWKGPGPITSHEGFSFYVIWAIGLVIIWKDTNKAAKQ